MFKTALPRRFGSLSALDFRFASCFGFRLSGFFDGDMVVLMRCDRSVQRACPPHQQFSLWHWDQPGTHFVANFARHFRTLSGKRLRKVADKVKDKVEDSPQ